MAQRRRANSIGLRENLSIIDPGSPDALSEAESGDEDDFPQKLDNFIRGSEDVLPVSQTETLLLSANGNYREGKEYKPLLHRFRSGTGPYSDQDVLDTKTKFIHSVRTVNTTEQFLLNMIKIWVALTGSVYFRTLHLICRSDNKVHFHMTNWARHDTLPNFKKRLNQLREQNPRLVVPVIRKIIIDMLRALQFMTEKKCTLNNINCWTVMINQDGLCPVFDDFTRAAPLQNLEDPKNDFLGIKSIVMDLFLPEGIELRQYLPGLDEDNKQQLLQLINCFYEVITNERQEGYFNPSRIITFVEEQLKKEHVDIEDIVKQATPILYPPPVILRNNVRLAQASSSRTISPDFEQVIDLQAMRE